MMSASSRGLAACAISFEYIETPTITRGVKNVSSSLCLPCARHAAAMPQCRNAPRNLRRHGTPTDARRCSDRSPTLPHSRASQGSQVHPMCQPHAPLPYGPGRCQQQCAAVPDTHHRRVEYHFRERLGELECALPLRQRHDWERRSDAHR